MTKVCKKCGIEKDESCFSKNKKIKDGLHSWCRECVKSYDHNRHHTQREKRKIQKKEWMGRNVRFIRNYKKERGCSRCGEHDPRCLTFHHTDPNQKEFNIATMLRSKSIESLIKEIDKCIILCMNCHMKEHIAEDIFDGE